MVPNVPVVPQEFTGIIPPTFETIGTPGTFGTVIIR
jgi:hypothetical protein